MHIINQFFILLADAVVPSQAAPATTVETMPSYEGVFLKMILTLALLVVGIIGTVWFLRRMGSGRFGGNAGRSIKVIEKKPLSPKTMLYLIEVEGKQTILAESQLEIKKLMELDSISPAEKEE